MFVVTFFDSILFFAILIAGLFGFARGFIREISRAINWISSLYLTVVLKPYVIPLLETKITTPFLLDLVVNALLFVVLVLVISLITTYLFSYLSKIIPDDINRGLGLLFGISEALIIILIIVSIISLLYKNVEVDKKPKWFVNSMTYKISDKDENESFFDNTIKILLGSFLQEENKVIEETESYLDTINEVKKINDSINKITTKERQAILKDKIEVLNKKSQEGEREDQGLKTNDDIKMNLLPKKIDNSGYQNYQLESMDRIIDILSE